MNTYDFIGYGGVLVASISLLPQICQIIKTKQVRDINRTYFFLCVLSELLYISYGFVKHDYVMVASTIPPMISQVGVIYLHCKYKKNEISDSAENN
tara:strand:+ start:2084 stop:2371 length:288 start_codon:yes stop_codon:yes gene_type:complete